ncbi:thrombopoietin isoform X1 [Cygnus olor]|uniref:thrombopoietin isoform X1 n=1 Tax=Cygnus olor TaxID=8869 RepID=UPI001ADE7A1D|nr:thrombopoietin isoform X1 [Cygnus olor]
MPGAAPGTNSRQEGLCWERGSAPCLFPRLERSLKGSTDTCHILPPPPAQLGTPRLSPASTESLGRGGTRGPPPPPWGRAPRPPRAPKPPTTGQSTPAPAARAARGGREPTGYPFSPRTAPPHILPPARQRGPCQPRAAGLRHQAHPEVHRGGQGHGEESEPVPSFVCAQLPRGAAPGGYQNHAVENQIGEEGWEDGPGVPVGLEKDPRNETKQREILCDLALLVGAVKGAQSQERQECWAGQLNQLYRHAEFFLRLLQTWEEGPWESGCSPGSKEINTAVIFLAYQRLLQGKLRFFFHDLAKDLCDRGQGGGRDPPPRGA